MVNNVITSSFTSTQTISKGTWTDVTNLSVTITPSSKSSRVLVFGIVSVGAAGPARVYTRLLRNDSLIGVGDSSGSKSQVTGGNPVAYAAYIVTIPFAYVDSPSTTSETVYKIQANSIDYPAYINRSYNDGDSNIFGRTISTITAMELKP